MPSKRWDCLKAVIKMNKLEQLINDLCPEGVEYKTLGEIGKFYGGLTGKSKKDFEDGNEVFITYKNVYSNPALDIYPNDKVKIADGEKQRTLEYGDIVFTGSSETPDECGFSSVVTREPDRKLYLNSFCCFFLLIWRPPALPHRLQCSTIGRLGLNRRVRDGNGCFPQAHRHQKQST